MQHRLGLLLMVAEPVIQAAILQPHPRVVADGMGQFGAQDGRHPGFGRRGGLTDDSAQFPMRPGMSLNVKRVAGPHTFLIQIGVRDVRREAIQVPPAADVPFGIVRFVWLSAQVGQGVPHEFREISVRAVEKRQMMQGDSQDAVRKVGVLEKIRTVDEGKADTGLGQPGAVAQRGGQSRVIQSHAVGVQRQQPVLQRQMAAGRRGHSPQPDAFQQTQGRQRLEHEG